MPIPISEAATLAAGLRARTEAEGFAACGIAPARADATQAERLWRFIAEGCHGDMTWMAATAARRASPLALWPEARYAAMLAMPYGDGADPMRWRDQANSAVISIYAQGADYHDVLKPKLKRIASWLSKAGQAGVKVFIDTAPLMEKPLAALAGLGWQGKHTNLVSRQLGSWFFLGAILTTARLAADVPETDHCGTCRACLDVCPTNAFPAPYRLDARRCISYLTIEHKGHIAREFRQAMGNRVFGCDDCLAVCPWNKFATAGREARLAARAEASNPPIADLLGLDETTFRARFSGSPIKRTGRDRFLRNVLIAAGNSGDRALVPSLRRLAGDVSPLVRAMAIWALWRLADREEFADLRQAMSGAESDADVLGEWYPKEPEARL